jgi:hypothetical protein
MSKLSKLKHVIEERVSGRICWVSEHGSTRKLYSMLICEDALSCDRNCDGKEGLVFKTLFSLCFYSNTVGISLCEKSLHKIFFK